ncbi:hypothetical protein KP509_04G108200 [Ceratopteris richardii]|uniref:Secreted protein n=1 Tax=Ceratopteris richardii TaxID=49495 RepID=A0A8T2V3X7_CERRI|nr:hypothetical protein KP509_04G108200 [Ceratopteris richardii]
MIEFAARRRWSMRQHSFSTLILLYLSRSVYETTLPTVTFSASCSLDHSSNVCLRCLYSIFLFRPDHASGSVRQHYKSMASVLFRLLSRSREVNSCTSTW